MVLPKYETCTVTDPQVIMDDKVDIELRLYCKLLYSIVNTSCILWSV